MTVELGVLTEELVCEPSQWQSDVGADEPAHQKQSEVWTTRATVLAHTRTLGRIGVSVLRYRDQGSGYYNHLDDPGCSKSTLEHYELCLLNPADPFSNSLR